jgi:hypothetical protein
MTTYKKLYVCWTSWGFVHHDIDDVAFTTYEEADKWLKDTMKVIEQCEGIRDAATRKYQDSDPKKYEQMLEEAWSFERKKGLKPMTNNAGIKVVEVFGEYDEEETRRKRILYRIS